MPSIMAMRNYSLKVIGLSFIIFLSACQRTVPSLSNQANFVSPPFPTDVVNQFTSATPGRNLTFPFDFGPHPDYQTEWWYYTGNLAAPDGHRFGYQLTFFRRALIPVRQISPRSSDLASSQAYLAHFAITDSVSGLHEAFELFSRGAAGLAGAQATPYQVWLYDWKVEETGQNTFALHAAHGDMAIDLILADHKGPILNGKKGYSQKGPAARNASYYYSLTRLITEGWLQIGDQKYSVSGASWMDHEFSTSALSTGQIGWDWFSFQLDDQRELMLYQIRDEGGTIDPYSSGTLVYADGSTRPLSRVDFIITVTGHWKSPHSGAVYSSRWTVSIPSENLTLDIAPLVADQEMNLSYIYWEGAVKVKGEQNNIPINGYGYVESTGYAGSISGQF